MSTTLNLNYEPNVLVETENLSREDWLNYRRRGIGGSDVAAIMGQSPFCTGRDIFYDKLDIKDVVDEEEDNWVAKEVGHLLEELVAKIFAKKTGLKIYPVRKMFQHPLYPFMLADVDYFIEFPDGSKGILECKTTNYNCQNKWADNSVPVNYEYQGRHYMSVNNVDKVYFACLYGNNEDEFIIRLMERDLDIESDLIAEEEFYWNEYVQKKVEPPYTEKSDLVLDSIRRHYGPAEKESEPIMLPKKHLTAIKKYLKIRDEKIAADNQTKKLEENMKQAYLEIVEEMGTNCKAIIKTATEEFTVTYNPAYRTGIDKKGLEKLQVQHPDIYDEFVSTSESRRFSVKERTVA